MIIIIIITGPTKKIALQRIVGDFSPYQIYFLDSYLCFICNSLIQFHTNSKVDCVDCMCVYVCGDCRLE